VCDPESGISQRIESSYEAIGDIPGYVLVNSFMAEFNPHHFVVGSQYERIDDRPAGANAAALAALAAAKNDENENAASDSMEDEADVSNAGASKEQSQERLDDIGAAAAGSA
jgi:hypothetical protein